MPEIGTRIRQLREQRGLTQGDLERATGLFRAYICRVEKGHTVPSLETIERFSAALGVPIHEMFRPPSGGGSMKLASQDSPFLGLLMVFVRHMSDADRELIVRVAERLAEKA